MYLKYFVLKITNKNIKYKSPKSDSGIPKILEYWLCKTLPQSIKLPKIECTGHGGTILA